MDIAVTFFILGSSPENYWVWLTAKCYFFLLGMWWHRLVTDRKELLYMLEFCWVACHAYMLYMTLGIFAGITNADHIKVFTHDR